VVAHTSTHHLDCIIAAFVRITIMSHTKRMMIVGLAQVLLGCIVGFIPPPAVLHFRSIVTAHIEFCVNGILLAVLGILTQYMNLSVPLFSILEISAYLGTFCNGGAFLISAFTGFGTKLAPTVNEKFPFPNGVEGGYSDLMTNCLLVCGITIVTSLVISILGLSRFDFKAKRG
jgi:hypothetical protein